MKFLFDLFPVILFFLAFKLSEARPEQALDSLLTLLAPLGLGAALQATQAPILVATVVVIFATALQIAWVWWRHGKVDKMLWVSLILVAVFGGLTLVLHDETFIKWKPTVLYWLFAVVLAAAPALFGKNLIRQMLEAQLQLPEALWGRLNLSWVLFFSLLGGLNLLIAFGLGLSTDAWVNFKLFGTMGLMFAFIIAQGMVLSKYMEEK